MAKRKPKNPEGAAPRSRPAIRLSRAYDAPPKRRTFRVLVDRLWPRGVTKKKLAIDAWMKEVAPSTSLRRWFNHRPERWVEFRRRYLHELAEYSNATDELAVAAAKRSVTLVYGARDERHNHAIVLREYLLRKRGRAPTKHAH